MAPPERNGGIGNVWRFLGLSSSPEETMTRPAASSTPAGPTDPGRAVLGGGLSLRGEISGEGDFHIYGRFEGEIDANINAAAIVIAGKVRGNLSATTHLDILPSGVLTGTLKAASFSAAEGSSVKGEIWLERAEPARMGNAGASDEEDDRR